MSKIICLIISWGLLASAAQVANFNISRSIAATYGCTSSCYDNFAAGLAADQSEYGDIYDVEFYATATNFSTSKPGSALKIAPIDPTLLKGIPDGTTAYRFQYVSRDVAGMKVPATGFIAFPWASRTNGHRYPTIAYAHGTSGVFRGCGPSAMPNLYEYGSWSYLLTRGYAVIATDYAGLGNNHTAHQYLASPAQANDLYFSVAAAHNLFPNSFTSEWMAVGHSQGGGAVWALAESSLLRENPLRLGKYLGSVAQAPATRIGEMALAALNSSSSGVTSTDGLLGELPWVVFGLRSILPHDKQSWLRPIFRKRLELMQLAQACFDSAEALVTDLDIDQAVDLSDPSVFEALNVMQNLTARGNGMNRQPLLVVQGLADKSVLPEVVEVSYQDSCRSGNEVHLQLYPKVDHDPVIPVSAPFFLQWLDDRFRGVPTSCKCSNDTVQPYDSTYVYAPADTD